MTAIQESIANHSFTSATIITRESFNLTSSNLIFEVSAALPTAEGVFGVILLLPDQDYTKHISDEAFVLLMNYYKIIQAGYIIPDLSNVEFFFTSPELSEFANFYADFDNVNISTLITWSYNNISKLNETRTNVLNISCKNQACDKLVKKSKFKLAITLVVGAKLIGGDVQEVIKRSNTWDCSSFIIDYVRVYDHSHHNNFTKNLFNNNSMEISAKSICNQVISELGREKSVEDVILLTSATTVILISLAIFLLVLVVILVIWLVLGARCKLKKDTIDPIDDLYDDHFEKENVYDLYEEINYNNDEYETVVYDQVGKKEQDYLEIREIDKIDNEYV